MALAYILSTYHYPQQLIRLVERLNSDSTAFFIHVDRKTEAAIYQQMVRGLSHLSTVRFLKRHVCYWGGFGHVAATLEGIAELLRTGIDFDYAILLTGQDYPIKSNRHIHQFFQDNRGKLYLNYFPLPRLAWQNCGMDRIEAWHWRFLNQNIRFPPDRHVFVKRKFPKGYQPFGGSSYWCLTRECVEYVHTCVTQNPAFVNFFKSVDVPDELFFQTLIMNSAFGSCVVNDDLRYVEWKDLTSGSPAILRMADLAQLMTSPKLFARKFDLTVDGEILDRIDENIRQDAD